MVPAYTRKKTKISKFTKGKIEDLSPQVKFNCSFFLEARTRNSKYGLLLIKCECEINKAE